MAPKFASARLSDQCLYHRIRRCMEAAASRSTLAAALRPEGVRKASTITSISLRERQHKAGGRVLNGTGREGWDEQQCTLWQASWVRVGTRDAAKAAQARSFADGQDEGEQVWLLVRDSQISTAEDTSQ